MTTIENLFDPFTMKCLDRIGIREGWRCLEVGAGHGSIARLLCDRVGSSGRVVATDIETEFLDTINAPNLEVRKHDITADELETEAFELVYSRKVLEFLVDPTAALRRMALAVRPGGWLLVEITDLGGYFSVSGPRSRRFEMAYTQFLKAMRLQGHQLNFGESLGREMRTLGFEDVQLNGLTIEWTAHDGNPVGKIYGSMFERLREDVIAKGLLSDEQVRRFFEDIQSPDFYAITGFHFAARGRKPI